MRGEEDAILAAAGDADIIRGDGQPALALQHRCDALPQGRRAARIAILEQVLARRALGGGAIGAGEQLGGEQSPVRRALVELEAGAGRQRERAFGGSRIAIVDRRVAHRRFRLGALAADRLGQRCRHHRPARPRRRQPALRDQILIGEHHRLAIDSQDRRQLAAAGEVGAGGQPPAFDVADQRLDDLHVDGNVARRIDAIPQADLPRSQHWTISSMQNWPIPGPMLVARMRLRNRAVDHHPFMNWRLSLPRPSETRGPFNTGNGADERRERHHGDTGSAVRTVR